jgi:hypothetical protein
MGLQVLLKEDDSMREYNYLLSYLGLLVLLDRRVRLGRRVHLRAVRSLVRSRSQEQMVRRVLRVRLGLQVLQDRQVL